jgi:hypothetical protein
MNIINLTPHAVRILADDGKTVLADVVPSGAIARVASTRNEIGCIPISNDAPAILARVTTAAIPVYGTMYGEVTGLPLSQPGVIYVVSALVRQAVRHRRDVMSPGELVRGADGQPIGCKGLDGN